MQNKHPKRPGRRKIYSNEAILCALLLRSVFHLPLRTLEGFLTSILAMVEVELPVPSYTQICRRSKELDKKLARWSKKQASDIVMDSTGVKV